MPQQRARKDHPVRRQPDELGRLLAELLRRGPTVTDAEVRTFVRDLLDTAAETTVRKIKDDERRGR